MLRFARGFRRTDTLFPSDERDTASDADVPPAAAAPPRLRRVERAQIEMRCLSLDQLLPPEHRARLVWDFVAGLDLAALYDRIKAVEGHVGNTPIDPKILFAL